MYTVAVLPRFDITKNEEMETLLVSLAYYRSTLIFRCTLAERRCYLLNVAATHEMALLFSKYHCYLLNVAAVH